LNHHINKKKLNSKIELWQLNQVQKELISKCNMHGRNNKCFKLLIQIFKTYTIWQGSASVAS